MNDNKNDNGVQEEFGTEQSLRLKTRKGRRNNNIYERFLDRVDSAEGLENTNDKVNQSSSIEEESILNKQEKLNALPGFEPLDEKELALFSNDREEELQTANQQKADNNHAQDEDNDAGLDFVVDDFRSIDGPSIAQDDSSIANDRPTVAASTTSITDAVVAVQSQPTPMLSADDQIIDAPMTDANIQTAAGTSNKKKPLIIGILFGTVLSAIIVIVLGAMGVLSTAKDTKGVKGGESISPSNSPSAVINSETKTSATNDVSTSTPPASLGLESNATQAVDSNPSDATNNSADTQSMNENQTPASSTLEPIPQPAITLDDFKEESQNTLYRETND